MAGLTACSVSVRKLMVGSRKRIPDGVRVVQQGYSLRSSRSIRQIHSGAIALGSGLYSYRFDSQTARSRGFTLRSLAETNRSIDHSEAQAICNALALRSGNCSSICAIEQMWPDSHAPHGGIFGGGPAQDLDLTS